MFQRKQSALSTKLRGFALLLAALAALPLLNDDRSFAATTTFDVLHRFPTDDNSGYLPGSLIQAADGNFYGTTRRGGGAACGTVYQLTAGGQFTQLHIFSSDYGEGCEPVGRLLLGLDGRLYGATATGSPGISGGVAAATLGTLFRIGTDGSGYEVLMRFDDPFAQGSTPNGALVQGADGTLYGTTSAGGANGNGTIFKVAADGSSFGALHSFAVVPAGQTTTSAGLLLASDGNLYGTLSSSPSSDGGVFKIATNGTGYTLIHQYAGNPNGLQSDGPLIEGNDGLLYGTGVRWTGTSCGSGCTSYTGSFKVFSLSKDGSAKSEPYTFSNTVPTGGLLQGSDGNLYGLASYLNGSVAGGAYRVATNGTGFTALHALGGTVADGSAPIGSLIAGSDGKLYGATQHGGGANSGGVVFSLTTAGVESVVHAFGTQFDGFIPVAGVTIGNDGLLYGATSQGGSPYFQDDPTGARGSEGAVFKLATDGSGTFGLLHSFTFANDDGSSPLGTPIQGIDGALYGTTTNGGAISSSGSVYRVTTAGNETLVHSFQFCSPCIEGFHPSAGLIQDANGMLFGTSNYGGTGASGNALGVVYKVNTDTTGYASLHSFTGGSDGAYPAAPLILASDNRLYGTASRGGSSGCSGGGCGTIFGLDADGAAYATLHVFAGSDDGALPTAGLLEASDGMLYGTTSAGGGNGCGGDGCGTVFRIARDGTGYQVLHAFLGGSNDGANPAAGLVQAADGTLYGTTRNGVTPGCDGSGCGIVFRIAPTGAYGVVHRLITGLDGAHPVAPLALAADGRLFGTASRGGGVLDGGTVFSVQDTPTFLPAPTGLGATAGNAQVTLSWTASAGATRYSVYQGTTSGGESAVAVATVPGNTSTVISGLTNGTTYFFVVKAFISSDDHSEASAETSAQPVGAPAVTLSVAPASITVGQSATLTWTSSGASSCTASNGWTGAQALSGTLNVTPASAGTVSYVLSCTGPGGTTMRTANLTVSAPGSGGGGGGGSLDPLALLTLLLALARRRMA